LSHIFAIHEIHGIRSDEFDLCMQKSYIHDHLRATDTI
jgi:hypothetical protein